MNGHRSLTTVVVILCGTAAACATAFAVIARHDVADERLVALGAEFPAAGQVVPDGGCTLIAPRWAVTAAHVAASVQEGSGRVKFEDREYAVARVIPHPRAERPGGRGSERERSGNAEPPVDLALLELKEPVKGIEPANLYRASDEPGHEAIIVGCGDVGDGQSRPRRSDGRRRAVTNVIDGARSGLLMMKFEKPVEGTSLEGVGGPGDSGGPAFIRKDGRVYLAGVSHASMGGKPGMYGLTDLYIRISDHIDWIEETTGIERSESNEGP